MRDFDRKLLDEAGKYRFRSEYDYAIFEYYRSPKLLKELDNANIRFTGNVLDDGCGSGGVVASFAEEFDYVVGLDIEPRFKDSGEKIIRDKRLNNISFIQGDGCSLPFPDNSFNLIISHSVIEHTFEPLKYLCEAYRTLLPDGILFLETPPYFSFEGAHMPRLKKPLPLQLFLPRKLLYKIYLFIARRKPHWIKGGAGGSALLTDLANGKEAKIEHLQKMTIGRLRRLIRKTDFDLVSEKLYCPGFFYKLPKSLLKLLKKFPPTRSFVVNTYKVFLRKPSES